MAEKIPSSTRFGSRPSAERMRAYSSGERPCAATIASVMAAIGRRTIADERKARFAGKLAISPRGGSDPVVGEIPQDPERTRLKEAERHHRILSEVSQVLLDYVGPDEVEPLRRIVRKVTEAIADWCAFTLVQPDGTLKNVATYHPLERQRDLAEAVEKLRPPRPWNVGPAETNALVQKRPIVIEEISDQMLRGGLPSEE